MKQKILSEIKDLLCTLATTEGPSNAEGPRLAILGDYLSSRGVKFHTDAVGNIHIQLGAGNWSDTLVLDAHVDVVGAGYCQDVEFEADRMIGLGVGDDLAAVAIMSVFACRAAEGAQCFAAPVRMIFTVGEEGFGNLRGVRQVVNDFAHEKQLPASKMYLAFDGKVNVLHASGIGSSRYRLVVSGHGGHSWSDYGRTSATAVLIDLLGEISKLHSEFSGKSGQQITFNIGMVTGGEGINCISRDAAASFEFRSESSELLGDIHGKMADMLEGIEAKDDIGYELEVIGLRPAAEKCGSDDFIELLREIWAEKSLCFEVKPASTNINMTLAAKWPSVCVGLCDCGNAHRPDEYVITDSLLTGYELLESIIEKHSESK